MSTTTELKTRLQEPMIVFMILLFSGLPIFFNFFLGDIKKADDISNSFFNLSISPNSKPERETGFPQLFVAKSDSLKEASKVIVSINQ
ncbi:MAG: hypothetical protein JST58_17720 [Bacteroidetes bacterium]|nr:hypothetical protein [Bacteroidota bacterium]